MFVTLDGFTRTYILSESKLSTAAETSPNVTDISVMLSLELYPERRLEPLIVTNVYSCPSFGETEATLA